MKKVRLVIPKDSIRDVQNENMVVIEDEYGKRLNLEDIGELKMSTRATQYGSIEELVLEFYIADDTDEKWSRT